MNILLVNYEYPPLGAGAATACACLARELVALGHRPIVLTSRGPGLPPEEVAEGVIIHRVRAARKRRDRARLIEMAAFIAAGSLALPALARRHTIDSCFVFFSFPSGPVAWFARMIYKIPYVVALRGGDVPGLVPQLRLFHRILQPLRRRILAGAEAVIANSEGLRRLSMEADSIPVEVVPNGVDTVRFHMAGETPPGPLQFLFVGRLQEQKNVEMLLKSFADMQNREAHLHIAGDGPLRAPLEELARSLDVSSRVTWHGWVSREQLPALYRCCDCLVNPSGYEGMPNVVLEAMASGLAVIASDIEGNCELVRHGESGYLFSLDEPAQLRAHLDTAAVDKVACRQMGAAGRAAVESGHSLRRVAEEYLSRLQGPGATPFLVSEGTQ